MAVVVPAVRRVWRRRRGEVRRDMSDRQSALKRKSNIHCSAVSFVATSRSWASFVLESIVEGGGAGEVSRDVELKLMQVAPAGEDKVEYL